MATKLRSITKRVLGTQAGPLQRLIGTTDCKGKGTKHPLAEVDPVFLCDTGKPMEGKGLPAFGMHPHYGLIAVTTVTEGAFADADNLTGVSEGHTEAMDIYAVSAGMGVCHEEHTAHEGRHQAIQTIFKIPADKLHFPPELIHIKKDQIPVVNVDGGHFRVNIGRLGDVECPGKLKAFPRAVMVRAFVDQGKSMRIPLDEDLEQGFVVVLDGKCKIGAEKEELELGGGLVVFGKGGELELDNGDGDKVCDALVVAGKPLNEPWVKMLGRNGFILAKEEAEADRIMEVIHREQNDFSYKKLM